MSANIIGNNANDSEEVAEMREQLYNLAASGRSERVFGTNKILTAAHVDKMTERQVRTSYARLESHLLGSNTDLIIESFISGVHRAAGAVVPLKDREALDKRIVENNAVTNQLTCLVGRLNRCSGVCIAGASWVVTLLNHIDWEKMSEERRQRLEQRRQRLAEEKQASVNALHRTSSLPDMRPHP